MPFVPGLKVMGSGGQRRPQRGRWLPGRNCMRGGTPPRGALSSVSSSVSKLDCQTRVLVVNT